MNLKKYIPKPNTDFECIHSFSYKGIFKPSIAEVLAQLTDTQVARYAAFEIVEWPQDADDFSKFPNNFAQNFHTSIVRLYEKVQQ